MAFLPIDPRRADVRRKALLQKIMGQQAQNPTASWHDPRMAGGLGVRPGSFLANIGRPMHAAGAGLSKLNFTQGSNVAQGVLERLGISGSSAAGEMSPGPGLPINLPPHPVYPPQDMGTPMPVGGDPGGISGAAQLPHQAPGGFNPPPPQQAPSGYVAPPTGAPSGYVDPYSAISGAVPLGNGLYYDPHTDTVIGSGMAGAGVGTRRLGI